MFDELRRQQALEELGILDTPGMNESIAWPAWRSRCSACRW